MASSPDANLTSRISHLISGDQTMLEKFADKASDLAFSLIVAGLILIVTFWLAGVAGKLIHRAIARARKDGDHDVTLQTFMASLARYVIVAAGIVAAIQQLGVQTTSILAVFGAASLAVGLALQGALSNVAAGMMILLFRPYRVGDLIEVGGRTGRVESLDLFATELATPDNVKVVVPNGKVFGDVITNFSAHAKRRVDVVFRVDPKRDLPAVLAGLKARAEADPRIVKTPAPLVEVTGMAELWVEGAVRAWAAREDYVAVKGDLMQAAYLLMGGQAPPPVPERKPPPAAKPAARKRLLRR
jgi:small conductance mechanosensitive channel